MMVGLRWHFQLGLTWRRICFHPGVVLTSPVGCAILYGRENANRVIDVVDLNELEPAAGVRTLCHDAQE